MGTFHLIGNRKICGQHPRLKRHPTMFTSGKASVKLPGNDDSDGADGFAARVKVERQSLP
jgi:hypothetical protein